MPTPEIYDTVQQGRLTLDRPPHFRGEIEPLTVAGHDGSVAGTRVFVKSRSQCQDTTLLSNLPFYFAAKDGPSSAESAFLSTPRTKTIFFQVEINRLAGSDAVIALGFAARPYPVNRLPGWHRASLAVHGDDGRRYVNDAWGGVDFVPQFRAGEVVGIGMRFTGEASHRGRTRMEIKAEAFFTRNGIEEDSWFMNEERDAERDEGVEGLIGELDLYAAIGVCGGVECHVRFPVVQ